MKMLYSVDTGWKPTEEFQTVFGPLRLFSPAILISQYYTLAPLIERTVSLASG